MSEPRGTRPGSDRTLELGPGRRDVFEFLSTLWELHNALQSLSKRMLRRIGLTGPQRLVVRVLGRAPGASAGQLARSLHLHASTLTGILRRLEEKRFVIPTARPDRRPPSPAGSIGEGAGGGPLPTGDG